MNNSVRKNSASVLLKSKSNVNEGARVSAISFEAIHSMGDQVINGKTHTPCKLATFEPDYWRLDGSCALPLPFNQNGVEVGFVSHFLSNGVGEFAPNVAPFIEIELDREHDIPTVGLMFDIAGNEALRRVRVQGFRDNGAISLDETIVNDGNISVSTGGGGLIRRLRITALATMNPNRRARITEVLFAPFELLSADQIKSINIIKQTDPFAEHMPSPSLDVRAFGSAFGADTVDCYLAMAPNPQGNTFDYIHQGNFEVESVSKRANITQITALGQTVGLDAIYYGSRFGIATIANVVTQIMAGTGLNVRFPSFFNAHIHIPEFFGNISRRRALALLARFTGTLLAESKEGDIVFIDPLENTENAYDITFDEIFAYPKAEQLPAYNGITIREITGARQLNRTIVQRDIQVAGFADILIDFDTPLFDGGTASVSAGFTLQNVQLSAMQIRARVMGNGNCILTVMGNGYSIVNTEDVFYPAPWHNTNDEPNPLTISAPFLITNLMHYQNAVLPWLLSRQFAILGRRLKVKADWRQNPHLNIGDRVKIQTDRGSKDNGIITYQELNLEEGVLKGRTEVICS